eukprot:gene8962-1607_t
MLLAIVTVTAGLAVADYPRPGALPPHSWDTVGNKVYIHGCNSEGLLSPSELALVAKYPLVTVEKGQGELQPGYAEDKMANLSRQYHTGNPDGSGLPFRRRGDPTFPQPADGMLIFNTTNPDMRKMFVQECLHATTPEGGGFSGCFIDSASWAPCLSNYKTCGPTDGLSKAAVESLVAGNQALLTELQAAGPDKFIVANDGGGQFNDTKFCNTIFLSDTFCSGYKWATWDQTLAAQCEVEIAAAVKVVAQGQVVLSHGEISHLRLQPEQMQEDFTFTLAAFLVTAGESSFFGFSDGWYYNGSRWWPEYDRPLGNPTGPATQTDGVWTRHFAAATVTLNVKQHLGKITWLQ